MFAPLPNGKFPIIYADPPWNYNGGQMWHPVHGKTTVAADYYPTIKVKDLKQLPVADIAADDCLLFMWVVSPLLDQCIELGKAWGFSYITVAFVWEKKRVNPGRYTMSSVEMCLVFKRGRIPKPRGAMNVRQFLQQQRGRHSEKPEEVRRRIEQMFPAQKKCELFARKHSKGWIAWGNELDEV